MNTLYEEKDELGIALKAVSADQTAERNTALLAVVQLQRENILLGAKNLQLEEDAAEAFNDAMEALSEVIDTSKFWAVKAFEMLAEPNDFPYYEHRLDF